MRDSLFSTDRHIPYLDTIFVAACGMRVFPQKAANKPRRTQTRRRNERKARNLLFLRFPVNVPSVSFLLLPKSTGVRVLPGGVPLPCGSPPHAGPEVRQQPLAEARVQRGQRGAP